MKKNKYSIRKLQKDEIAYIVELAKKIWEDTYPEIISKSQIEYMLFQMYSYDIILKEIKNGILWFTILYQKDLIGFISFGEYPKSVIKIHKFYIKKEFQRMGVGGFVLEEVKKEVFHKNCKFIKLNVNRYNQIAINAYLKYGFVIEESLDIPYGEFTLNDYIMKYAL